MGINIKNNTRLVNAILGQATIDKYGKTFAVQFGLDGINIVNNTIQPMPNSLVPYLEGDNTITKYAVPINVDELCDYALASFPNIEELTLFSLDVVSVEDHLSYLSKLKIMYVNQNNLSGYSWFPTTIHSGYESFTSVDDYIGYVVVYNALPYIVTENNKNDLEIVAGTTIAYDKYLTNITVDYTYEIKDYTQDHKLTSAIITEQLNDLTSQQRDAITKLVIANTYTSSSVDNVLWGYNFNTLLPYLNNNIYYNGSEFDFSAYTIQDNTEDHILTASVVETELAKISSDKYTEIEKIIVPVDFIQYASGSITKLQAFMTTNSIDKLVTTYEGGAMELDLQGDIVAKIVEIGKTLDEALVYARTMTSSDIKGSSSNANMLIIPPNNITFNFGGNYNSQGIPTVFIYNLIANNIQATTWWSFFGSANLLDIKIKVNSIDISGSGVLFVLCSSLKRIDLDFTNTVYNISTTNPFYLDNNYSTLEKVILTNLTYQFRLRQTSMTEQAFIDLFNSLGTPLTKQTITLNATDFAKLSDDTIAIATAKNWQVVSA